MACCNDLLTSSRNGCLLCTRNFINAGSDLEARDTYRGRTPLCHASLGGTNLIVSKFYWIVCKY